MKEQVEVVSHKLLWLLCGAFWFSFVLRCKMGEKHRTVEDGHVSRETAVKKRFIKAGDQAILERWFESASSCLKFPQTWNGFDKVLLFILVAKSMLPSGWKCITQVLSLWDDQEIKSLEVLCRTLLLYTSFFRNPFVKTWATAVWQMLGEVVSHKSLRPCLGSVCKNMSNHLCDKCWPKLLATLLATFC